MTTTESKEKILSSKVKEWEWLDLFISSDLFKQYWTDRITTLIEAYEREQNVVPTQWEDIASYWLRMAVNNKVLAILKDLRDKPHNTMKALELSIDTRIRLKKEKE